MELIDKSAVIAEIEKRIKETESMQPKFDQFWAGQISAFKGVLKILDTLEVKEVDEVKIGETQIYLEDDGGEQPYDGKQWLDLSCTEYEIPKALFKDGDNVEIIIRKAHKGE